MKVLKTTDTSKWSYKFTCAQCESELEAERGDVKHQHYSGDFREPSYDVYTVSCPICKRSQTIPMDKIPKALQIQIKNKKFSNPEVSYVNLDDEKQNPERKDS
jgi:hypothetical protein